MNVIDQFQFAIASTGLPTPDAIHADGTLHRFATDGKRSDTSGWYVPLDDGDVPAGAFGCWHSGARHDRCGKTESSLPPAQREAHRRRMQTISLQREADKAQRQQEAAAAAAQRWEAAQPKPANHPYLLRMSIKPCGINAEGETLLVPLRNASTRLHSLQAIAPEGEKRFQPGGRTKDCYFGIGKPQGALIVCEGVATGASIREATGHAVACAMNAGNLLEVATAREVSEAAPELATSEDGEHGGCASVAGSAWRSSISATCPRTGAATE